MWYMFWKVDFIALHTSPVPSHKTDFILFLSV